MVELIEWVSAGDALDRLEARLGGRSAAKETLAEMLRDGKLAARSDRAFETNERDVNVVWEGRNEEWGEYSSDFEITQDHWRESVHWSNDLDLWRWPESFFVITHSQKPFSRSFFDGVSFLRADIDLLLSGEKATVPPKGRGGRRPDLQRWEAFWMEVVQIARDGNLVPGQVASQAALREDLLAAMRGNPLSDDSIKEPVRRIWERFCEK